MRPRDGVQRVGQFEADSPGTDQSGAGLAIALSQNSIDESATTGMVGLSGTSSDVVPMNLAMTEATPIALSLSKGVGVEWAAAGSARTVFGCRVDNSRQRRLLVK